MDSIWQQMCEAAGLDPVARLAAREAVLADAAALECSLYRPDEQDPDAEEEDLGEARVLLQGLFVPPSAWSAQEVADFYDGEDPQQFFSARIECEAAPGSAGFFMVEPGDYAAVTEDGLVVMYFVCDCHEDDAGLHCILQRDEIELD